MVFSLLSSVRLESIPDPKLRKSYHDAVILEMKSDLSETKLPTTEHLCEIIFGLTVCFWGSPETGMAIKIKTTQIGGEGIKTSSQ